MVSSFGARSARVDRFSSELAQFGSPVCEDAQKRGWAMVDLRPWDRVAPAFFFSLFAQPSAAATVGQTLGCDEVYLGGAEASLLLPIAPRSA